MANLKCYLEIGVSATAVTVTLSDVGEKLPRDAKKKEEKNVTFAKSLLRMFSKHPDF